MTFLVLMFAVAVAEWRGVPPALQRHDWFTGWSRWLAGSGWFAAAPAVGLGVLLLVPPLALALLLAWLGGWMFGLVGIAINLAVLFFAFGRGDLKTNARHYRDDLARGDVQAAWHDAARLHACRPGSSAENWPELHDQVIEGASYKYFERYFPVLFWFVLLGAPGALLYRLTALAAVARLGEERCAATSLRLLEWLPLRLLGLAFALMGDFATAMREWRATLFDTASSSAQVLARLVRAALGTNPAPSIQQGAAEIDALAALYFRALILSLGMIALLILLA